jgi:GT2 family glycosyltransferase
MNNVLSVILNWNNSDSTINIFNNFISIDDNCDYCIIDNNSNDIEKLKLLNYFKNYNSIIITDEYLSNILLTRKKIYLILNKNNDGYAKGNNIGANLASILNYDYILILNNDLILIEPIINSLLKYLRENENIAIIGPRIIDKNGNTQGPYNKDYILIEFFKSIFYIFFLFYNQLFKSKNNKSKYAYRLMGCCLMIKTHILKKINYFDENTFLYYEEAILSEKLAKINMDTFYLSDISIIHFHQSSTKKINNKILNDIQIKSGLYYYKNYRKNNNILLFLFILTNKYIYKFWHYLIYRFKNL